MSPAPAVEVLIVAHDPSLLRDLPPAIHACGLATDIATDGVEAKRLLARNDYAVVVLDLDLPDGSALEILDSVRADSGAVPNILIVADSAPARVSANAHVILKPVDPAQVASHVCELALARAVR